MSDTYPPLTSLADYPLHGWDYEGKAYACQGGDSQYDWRCRDCVSIAQGDDPCRTVRWRQSADHDEREVTLGWLITRSKSFGVLQ